MINGGENRNLLREAGSRYEARRAEKRKVKYSVIDYFHFPAGRNRCELIDGVIYDMASPTALHQGMSLREGIGCAIMFAAIILSQLSESLSRRPAEGPLTQA